MSDSDTYNVVSTGDLVAGADPAEVQQHLVRTMKLKPEQAAHFFDQQRVVKKGVSQARAEQICAQLARLGVVAEAKNTAPNVAPTPAEPTLSLQEDTPATSEPLALVEEPEAAPTLEPGMIECPSCGHVQQKAEQCESCGVWFHKLEPQPPQGTPQTEPQVQPISASEAIPGMAAAASSAEPISQPLPAATASDDNVLNPVAIAAAAGAAVVGAWVWKFVAVQFGFEFGLIAWAIGGAVGFAAASMGSRGLTAGIVCAVLALGSIVLGKYWAYTGIVDMMQEAVATALASDDDLIIYYEQELEDAAVFARGSGSDAFVRRFMVQRQYTEAAESSGVTDTELAEFREYVEPRLIQMSENEPTFEQWQNEGVAALDEISAWDMIKEDSSLFDLLFAALGIGTAFRLGSQMG